MRLETGLAFASNARVLPSSLQRLTPKRKRHELLACSIPPPPASDDLPEASAAGELALELLAQQRLTGAAREA